MLIKEWIVEFLDRHRARFVPHDWPDPESDEWIDFVRGWITSLRLKDVTQPEAEAASIRLNASPPRFKTDHIPMLLAVIQQIRDETGQGAAGAASGTRESAKERSKGCRFCSGEGLASVDARDPVRSRTRSVSAYCVCEHGRFVKRSHAEKTPDLARRFPDLGEVLDGRSEWLWSDPDRAPRSPWVHLGKGKWEWVEAEDEASAPSASPALDADWSRDEDYTSRRNEINGVF